MSCSNSQKQALAERQEVEEYARNQGRLGQLAMLGAVQDQLRATAGIAKVREAEERFAMQQLYGQTPSEADEEMHLTVLGDLNANQQAAPAATASQGGSAIGQLAKLALGAGLLATGAGAGIGIPLLLNALQPAITQPAAPPQQLPKATRHTIERDYSIGDVRIEGP